MNLKSFRIRQYRSIKDSGQCFLSGDGLTIIAGKNEAGKTSILEALEDFNGEKKIRDEALRDGEEKPVIELTFEADPTDIDEIFSEAGISLSSEESSSLKRSELTLLKTYPEEYSLADHTLSWLRDIVKKHETSIRKKVETLGALGQKKQKTWESVGLEFPTLDVGNAPASKQALTSFGQQVSQKIPPEMPERVWLETQTKEMLPLFDMLEKLKQAEGKFLEEALLFVPNFILFSSFEDKFPSKITLDEAEKNDLVKDFSTITGLNLKLIRSENDRAKQAHKVEYNISLKEEYKRFWSQDDTHMQVDWEPPHLKFFIKDENGQYFFPNQRSKGKQWHLSFYVRVAARAQEDILNIILIDEPGLYLHANAQKDILRRLADAARHAPIIFTTHSPYLIDPKELHRIRLVAYSSKNGTQISNKIHKGADQETLTPITTSIGLDLSIGISPVKENNVLLEGITDYYYLTAFEKMLEYKFKKDTFFIPSVGADKTLFLIPLMVGWGLNYSVLLDNDKKGTDVRREIEKRFGHLAPKVLHVMEGGGDIEDLFTKEDFARYVLEIEPAEMGENTNSQYLKAGKGYDKVLLAKRFCERKEHPLSDRTKENFRGLMERISSSLYG